MNSTHSLIAGILVLIAVGILVFVQTSSSRDFAAQQASALATNTIVMLEQ